jgi:hypothetical protein
MDHGASHDLGERRLARAVLTNEGVDLARVELKRNVTQDRTRSERLEDPLHLERDRGEALNLAIGTRRGDTPRGGLLRAIGRQAHHDPGVCDWSS